MAKHKDMKDAHNELAALLDKQGVMTKAEFEENVVLKPNKVGASCPCCKAGDSHDYHVEFPNLTDDRVAKIMKCLEENPTRKQDANS